MERVYSFVDGAHLRKAAVASNVAMVDPALLTSRILTNAKNAHVQRGSQRDYEEYILRRTFYFDARPDDDQEIPEALLQYWEAVEHLPDVEIGWGSVRGVKGRRQKRVDTLLSVAFLVGAQQRLFETAVLVAGDEDFVPAVDEVRRLGVNVILATVESEASKASRVLIRAADRHVAWSVGMGWVPVMRDGKTFEAI